jgi:hypothetical protein
MRLHQLVCQPGHWCMLGDLIMQLLRIKRVAKTTMIKGVSHQHGKAPEAEVSSVRQQSSPWQQCKVR